MRIEWINYIYVNTGYIRYDVLICHIIDNMFI